LRRNSSKSAAHGPQNRAICRSSSFEPVKSHQSAFDVIASPLRWKANKDPSKSNHLKVQNNIYIFENELFFVFLARQTGKALSFHLSRVFFLTHVGKVTN
jgi:hypothetical protein